MLRLGWKDTRGGGCRSACSRAVPWQRAPCTTCQAAEGQAVGSQAAGGSCGGGSGASTRASVVCQVLRPAPSRHATKSMAAPSLAVSAASEHVMTCKNLLASCLHRSFQLRGTHHPVFRQRKGAWKHHNTWSHCLRPHALSSAPKRHSQASPRQQSSQKRSHARQAIARGQAGPEHGECSLLALVVSCAAAVDTQPTSWPWEMLPGRQRKQHRTICQQL